MTEKAKWVVCPDCHGDGSHGPGWVWTQDDVAQEDPEEFAELQADLRAGKYDVPCEFCKGARVVTPEHAAEYEEELEYRHLVEMEQRFGC